MTKQTKFRKAETLGDVKDIIGEILLHFRKADSALGFFSALYTLVAKSIEESVQKGAFHNQEQLITLDLYFVNLYIDAMNCAVSGKPALPHWQACIDAANNNDLPALEHLFLAMNAHINYDLGTAVKNVVPDDKIIEFKSDFMLVNSILFNLLNEVQTDVAKFNWVVYFWLLIGRKIDDLVISKIMAQMRESAFGYTCLLALCNPQQAEVEMAEKMKAVVSMSTEISIPAGWLKALIIKISWRTERGTTDEKINDLLK